VWNGTADIHSKVNLLYLYLDVFIYSMILND